MNTNSAPLPTLEDLATEQLVAAVGSAICGIQERLPNLAADGQDAKWSVPDLVRLFDLRDQLQGECPRTIFACWVDRPLDSSAADSGQRNIGNVPDLPNHRN